MTRIVKAFTTLNSEYIYTMVDAEDYVVLEIPIESLVSVEREDIEQLKVSKPVVLAHRQGNAADRPKPKRN